MKPIDEVRKRVAKRKHTFVMISVIAALQIAFGCFFIGFVLTHGVRLYKTFKLAVVNDESLAIFTHPILMMVLGVWILTQGIYFLVNAIATVKMSVERALLEHIDGDS